MSSLHTSPRYLDRPVEITSYRQQVPSGVRTKSPRMGARDGLMTIFYRGVERLGADLHRGPERECQPRSQSHCDSVLTVSRNHLDRNDCSCGWISRSEDEQRFHGDSTSIPCPSDRVSSPRTTPPPHQTTTFKLYFTRRFLFIIYLFEALVRVYCGSTLPW